MSTPAASGSSSSATYYAMKEMSDGSYASLKDPEAAIDADCESLNTPQPRPFHSSVLSFAKSFGRHLLTIILYLLIHIPHGVIILITLAFVTLHVGAIVIANKEIDWPSFADTDAAFEEIPIHAEYDDFGRFLFKVNHGAGIALIWLSIHVPAVFGMVFSVKMGMRAWEALEP
ncbi:unnamed protein product [Peniophora sp. CBMAI 1063]|nr:unnamed protein product [Peniophora sp. CBMAI 1063]